MMPHMMMSHCISTQNEVQYTGKWNSRKVGSGTGTEKEAGNDSPHHVAIETDHGSREVLF